MAVAENPNRRFSNPDRREAFVTSPMDQPQDRFYGSFPHSFANAGTVRNFDPESDMERGASATQIFVNRNNNTDSGPEVTPVRSHQHTFAGAPSHRVDQVLKSDRHQEVKPDKTVLPDKVPDADNLTNRSITQVVENVFRQTRATGRCRLMITGLNDKIEIRGDVLHAARAISRLGGRVVLVDVGNSECTLAEFFGFERSPGIRELLRGEAEFTDVIKSAEDSNIHFVCAGNPDIGFDEKYSSNRSVKILEALDQTYDIVIIHGETNSAREFITAFDCVLQSCICLLPDYCTEEQASPARLSELLGFRVRDTALFPIYQAKKI